MSQDRRHTPTGSGEPFQDYVETIADTHGVSGYTTLADGTLVYAAYHGDSYDLRTRDEWITDSDADITSPRCLAERDSLLASRDVDGTERFDLIEIDPESGAITPILDDRFLNMKARQHPTDADVLAFISNRDRSLDLYTVDLATGEPTKLSETDQPVLGYAWSPEGDRLVYQAGTFEDTSLRLVSRNLDRDDVLFDYPDSEQSIAFTDGGAGAWTEEGIVFTTNHVTGYRELAVGTGDGDDELRYVNRQDKYEPTWIDGGKIAFVESRGGDRQLHLVDEGDVTTVESRGMNTDLRTEGGELFYTHADSSTAGDLKRDGESVVSVGTVDVPTVSPEEITYEAFDGTEIAARLYRPDREPIGGVVKVHGGPEAQHYNRLDVITQALVHAGFEVIAPDFRGSLGYGRNFRKASDGDLGGDDLSDVVAAGEYLRSRGRSSVGVLGSSYGGYLSLMALGTTDAFDMGGSVCGVVNWKTTVENAREYLGDVVMRKLGGTPEEKATLYEERSPISHVDGIEVPLLVVQGANDPRVPESEAEQLISSLRERDIDYEYRCFEDEGHGIVRTDNRIEYITQTVEFFSEQV